MLPLWWKRKQPSVDSTQPTGQPAGVVVGALVGAAVGAGEAAVGYCVGPVVGGGQSDEYEKASWSTRNWSIALVIILNSLNV